MNAHSLPYIISLGLHLTLNCIFWLHMFYTCVKRILLIHVAYNLYRQVYSVVSSGPYPRPRGGIGSSIETPHNIHHPLWILQWYGETLRIFMMLPVPYISPSKSFPSSQSYAIRNIYHDLLGGLVSIPLRVARSALDLRKLDVARDKCISAT